MNFEQFRHFLTLLKLFVPIRRRKENSCSICAESLELILASIRRGESTTFQVNPTKNASGCVTEWHIAYLSKDRFEIIKKD